MNQPTPAFNRLKIQAVFWLLIVAASPVFAKEALHIGSRGPGGGVVFHVDSDGHGLEAKFNDEPALLTWPAAKAAAGAYGDGWRLPSRVELRLLYQQKALIGGFSNGDYWSAGEHDADNAWAQYFDITYNFYNNFKPKNSPFRVRAVRSW